MKSASQLRKQKIESVRHSLLWNSFPRIQITVILLLTALAGFLTSFTLLHLGISSMALRYPIAIGAAYCIFLLFLRVWLWMQKSQSGFDLPGLDFSGSSGSSGASEGSANFEFGGGDFGGGGAGGSWGESVSSSADIGGNSVLDGAGFDLDLEELGLILLAIAALIGGILASFYIIYISPVLLAEILVDGALVAGLYNRVKNIERTSWLKTAVKRTVLPAVLSLIFFTIAGFALQNIAPEANSIGAVWQQIENDKTKP